MALSQPLPETIAIPGFTDPVSSLTHLLGAGVFAVLTGLLLQRGRGHTGRMISLGVFGFACVFLMSMSGVFHLLSYGVGRAVMQRLDHSAIFVLIAGTFTPAHAILFRDWKRWLPLFLIWSAAATGITLKSIYFNDMSESLGLALYLGMGWLGLGSGLLVWWCHGWRLIPLLLWGALAYTIGAVLEYQRLPVLIPNVLASHELFHLAVLIGAGFHFRFVWQIANWPMSDPTEPEGEVPAGRERSCQVPGA